jgi:hypothetical protein
MGIDSAAPQPPAEGSFYKYLLFSGDFVTTMARAIQCADPVNRARLRLAFPQMVAAFEHRSWDEAPPGFAPNYQAVADIPHCQAGKDSAG